MVPADDRVIGKALRWSGLALLALGLVVGLTVLVVRRQPEAPPETTIQQQAPEVVERPVQVPKVHFNDVTSQAGIEFAHFNGATGEKLLPETMGSGAAFFDFDNDDDADLLLVNSTAWPHSPAAQPAPKPALYRNDGNGGFSDISESVGLDLSIYGTGVAAADFDADGRVDLFMTAVGGNRLLKNLGDRFLDVTQVAGVGGDPEEWSASAAFFDYDNDGDLDLFVANYVRWSRQIDFEVDYQLTGVGRAYGPPTNYEGTFPYLYRNDGDGTFTDVSAQSGVQVRNEVTGVPAGKGLGLLPIDADADGWMDLFVANDTVQNFFLRNLGDGTFEESAAFWGLGYGRDGEATGAMGVDAAYYRNDGELGFAIGNFANEMTSLYISQGDPSLYADEAIGEGVGAPSRLMLSFGVLFLDYDLDGRLDLLQTNGHLEGEINTVDPSQTYEQTPQLFWNAGIAQRQTFTPVPGNLIGDLNTPLAGRGSATADVDGDGDLDLLLTQVGRPPLLLRNDQQTGNHWLRLKLIGSASNWQAIGARVELQAGGITQRRQVMPTRSYLSQSELPLTFGLGQTAEVESLTVFWPDGTVQTVPEITVDTQTTIEKP
ncbi:MAG: CRTAC1 family protein [Thermoanaerobaculia bacterium]